MEFQEEREREKRRRRGIRPFPRLSSPLPAFLIHHRRGSRRGGGERGERGLAKGRKGRGSGSQKGKGKKEETVGGMRKRGRTKD